jgi:hypothetical protein
MVSEGAGAEMRRTLGTAVFAGMLGVTLFGIFLTPVFYYVIQWMKDHFETADADSEEMNEHTPLAYFISGLGHGLKEIEGRNGTHRLSSDQRATLERGLNRIQELLKSTHNGNGQGNH